MDIGKLQIRSCDNVYYPREDSMMLAEEVNKHAFGKVLDLGTGSGIQGIAAAMNGCDVTFADIDEKALECAKENAKLNGAHGRFIRSDMFDSIDGRFNTVIFNPPYLLSGSVKELDLDGGRNGRELIDRFLSSCWRHVLKEHVILLLESSLNGYEKDCEKLNATVSAKAHYFFEDLVVLRF